MIKNFYVYSRTMIEHIEPYEVPHVIVSIRTPGDPDMAKLPINEYTLQVAHLSFYDFNDAAFLESEIKEKYDAGSFNREHARIILRLIETNQDAETFIVHCDAGLSRSPGVAAAVSKILTDDDSYFFKRYHPNSRVYRTILEEHFAPGD